MTRCDRCGDESNSDVGLVCGRVDEPGQEPCRGTYREPLRLFFYGTLMSREGRGGFLPADAVRSIRPAAIRGDLYDVGWFPAYLPGDGIVVGEVWEIEPGSEDEVLAITDSIESYRPDAPERSMYVRETVRTLDGEEVQAYRWNGLYGMLRARIWSGDWRNRFSSADETPMEVA
jgi:gamma-glutamylcyclotransferase (GGCT)/AIG2-like uncharacterized protein YtfP